MGLLSTDIKKVKRLSLKEVKLPTKERIAEPTTPIKVERPPLDEEIAYSKIVASYPLTETLVESLDLVSPTTKKRIRKVEMLEDNKPSSELEDKATLKDFAQDIVGERGNYTKQEIVRRIKLATNSNQDKAEESFNLLLKFNLITPTLGRTYYLTSSTPF